MSPVLPRWFPTPDPRRDLDLASDADTRLVIGAPVSPPSPLDQLADHLATVYTEYPTPPSR